MIKKLYRKLCLLYTLTSSLLLTAILVCILILDINKMEKASLKDYENLRDTVTFQLQTSPMLNTANILRMESENNLLIEIEDSGKSLAYTNNYRHKELRNEIIEKAKGLALKENVDTSIYPYSVENIKSSIFKITTKSKETYLGSITILPQINRWQSIIVCQSLQNNTYQRINQILFFLFLDVIGMLFFFLISLKFVGKTLHPVVESNKKQREFIAAASHELRSPLAVIEAAATNISEDPTLTKEFILDIQEECNQMTKLVDDLLELAASDANSWKISKQPIDLEKNLLNLYDKYSLVCQTKNLTLELHLPDEQLPSILWDESRFVQVISILLNNAIQYSNDKSSIELIATSAKNNVIIQIVDHGIGIKDEDKKHIFERFYQTDKARSSKKHYGLGLSIAHEIIIQHNSTIGVYDTPDGGTTFELIFDSY